MKTTVNSFENFLEHVPDERKEAFSKLYNAIKENIPEGFEESFVGGMIHFEVPHSLYPKGYHCDPNKKLPFLSLASQKNAITLYHFAMYCYKPLLDWFVLEYPNHSKTKLDMGKSCIRFKKPEHIPFSLITTLANQMSVQEWIDAYENSLTTHKKA